MRIDLSRSKGQRRARNVSFSVFFTISIIAATLLAAVSTRASVVEDLSRLRNLCLYYAAGHAPTDTNTITLRHGLYAQSPFSRTGEVDLAASAFSLAALPAATANGIISSNAAFTIAADAAQQVRTMVARSASATTDTQIRRYGYGGILCHYPVWDSAAAEFRAQPGVEFSSIDTTLLMYGLMVSANYFGGPVRSDYEAARGGIRWREWLDTRTPGHKNQLRMAYWPGSGFSASWWDWYTQEAMLIGVFAAMSDESIDPVKVWQGWRRDRQTYVSPAPDAHRFRCYTTYFGDPFTLVYGQAFLDFARFPQDIDNTDWFRETQTAYQANLEFFKKERGYADGLSSGFSVCAENGVMAKPNGKRCEPLIRSDATIYTLAGGLPYFGGDATANPLAVRLSELLDHTPGFIAWHGWPVASVNATNPAAPAYCHRIIGQDIAFIGLAIDNFLDHRAQDIALRDPDLRRTLNRIFPPRTHLELSDDARRTDLSCRGIPFSAASLEGAAKPGGGWASLTNVFFGSDGTCRLSLSSTSPHRFLRFQAGPPTAAAPGALAKAEAGEPAGQTARQ